MNGVTRRRVLGVAGGLAAGGLAGCGALPGQSKETATPTRKPYAGPDEPAYAPWLVTPGAFDREGYVFVSGNPDVFVENGIPYNGIRYAGNLQAVEYLPGIELRDTTWAHGTPLGFVVEATYDRETFVAQLAESELDVFETYRGFDIHARADSRVAVGLRSGYVVRSSDAAIDPIPAVKALVDAAVGAAERYAAVDPTCRRLLSVLDEANVVAGQPTDAVPVEGAVGSGVTWDVDGDTASFTGVVLFPDAENVDAAAVRTLVGETGFFDTIIDVTVSTDGPVALIEGTKPTDGLTAPFLFPWMQRDRLVE